MGSYQPWDDTWRQQIVYITIPYQVEAPVEMPSNFSCPMFLGAIAQGVKGESFWQAVAGAMVYVIGHDPGHPQVPLYVHWLNSYNPAVAKELNFDGADQASKGELENAIWLLQAAVLLKPEEASAHYNLGLAFYELGLKLHKQGKIAESEDCFKSATQYLKNTLEIDPDYGLAYYNLGFVYKSLGLMGESEKYLQKGILLGLEKVSHEDTRLRE